MNQNKSLTYESLKTILQHIDANIRFKLASHIPSIRHVEKSVPLKIEKFVYNGDPFLINNIRYSICIYRKSKSGQTPSHVQYTNRWALLYTDIDKNGFSDRSGKGVKLPGDVAFQENFQVEEVRLEENEIEELEKRLKGKENELAKLLSMAPIDSEGPTMDRDLDGKVFEHYVRLFGTAAEISPDELSRPVVEIARKHVVQTLEISIVKMKEKLQPYYNRRDNISYQYAVYIQLLISPNSSFSSTASVELVEYNSKLHKAEKYLCHWLFGNRKSMVYVNYLKVFQNVILRVPFGLKLTIRKLEVYGTFATVYEELKQIIDESSYPLECLNFADWKKVPDYDHPIIKTARKLIISHRVPEGRTWLSIYKKLQNPIVHKWNEDGFSNDDYCQLVQNWLENEKEIGTFYSFRMRETKTIIEILEMIKEQFDDAISGENCVTIPINSLSNVKVSCEAEQGLFEDEEFKAWCSPWILRMVVTRRETHLGN